MGFSFGFYFFSRNKKKCLCIQLGFYLKTTRITKKITKKTGILWDSTKKPVKRFWDSTEKRFFGFQFFSHRNPSFFSGIPGFWTKKSTIFVISATLGFPAKKRLVLHVLSLSHPNASLARTVLKPSCNLAGTL